MKLTYSTKLINKAIKSAKLAESKKSKTKRKKKLSEKKGKKNG